MIASCYSYEAAMTTSTKSPYAGHRFPPERISDTVWLYFRFPPSLRMVEEMLAFRGIEVSHETIRQWGLKRRFSQFLCHASCNQKDACGLEQGLNDEAEAVVAQSETLVLQDPCIAALDRPAPFAQS
jgi:hypothetical protein